MSKIKLAPWQLSLLSAVFIVAANNGGLFASLSRELDVLSADGFGFLLTITVLMVFVLNTLFLIFGVGRLQKAVLAVFFIATSILGYFSNEMGVVFHEEMFLNIAETLRDNNSAEAIELTSLPLMARVFFFGILPSALLIFVDLVHRPFFRELGTRVIVAAASLALLSGVVLPNYKYVTYFSVEHRDLRFKVMPIFPIMSLVRLTQDKLHREQPFKVIDADATRFAGSGKRTVGIMVVGETARADHFSLNGYQKQTNPMLSSAGDIVFGHGESCGTSTLFSVPCMFSIKGRDTYTASDAEGESNVLDILTAAGVRTIWIDNNSSCKHACDRIENVNLRQDLDEASPYYSDMGYFDGVLTENIDAYLDGEGQDTLIVLHSLGSHGPAYSRRYPPQFGVFTPYCDKASPKECSDELVSNAYDNTIVYTDYVLSQLIDRLRARVQDFDSFLLYASDHGESLGENGVYLHGLPYALAPKAQTDVPFILWLSNGFQKNHAISQLAVEQLGLRQLSHDNISHTLMGFYDVEATSYVAEQDLFARPDRGHARTLYSVAVSAM